MDKTKLRIINFLKVDLQIILDENEHEFFLQEQKIKQLYKDQSGQDLMEQLALVNPELTLRKVIDDLRPNMYSYVMDPEMPGFIKRETLGGRQIAGAANGKSMPSNGAPAPIGTPLANGQHADSAPIVQPPPGFNSVVGSERSSRASSLAANNYNGGRVNGNYAANGSPAMGNLNGYESQRGESPFVTHPPASYNNLDGDVSDAELKRTAENFLDQVKTMGYEELPCVEEPPDCLVEDMRMTGQLPFPKPDEVPEFDYNSDRQPHSEFDSQFEAEFEFQKPKKKNPWESVVPSEYRSQRHDSSYSQQSEAYNAQKNGTLYLQQDRTSYSQHNATSYSQQNATSYSRLNQPRDLDETFKSYTVEEQEAVNEANRGFDEALASLKIDHASLFYSNRHHSVKNSAEVNAYRSQKLIPFKKRTTRLYETPTNSTLLKYLNTKDYHATIINLIQFLHHVYPNGCDLNELRGFERQLQKRGSPFKLGVQTTISSLAECVRRGLITAEKRPNGTIYRALQAVVDVELWSLPPGLPSNLFRVLSSFGEQQLSLLMDRTDICLDDKSDFLDEQVNAADFIRIANNFPLIFKLNSHDKQVYSQDVLTSIQIEKSCPRWKVLLDCPNINFDHFYCDCRDCSTIGVQVTYEYT
ncbi:unnamed protein product [Bursaphelenchus okinawaensis]|uniref:Uncharacterized protein n=1 Tax=Bursaphelenchus okinawaensis TaxID=465554 RepID=A0A811JVC3_9BILA|nr:unnamed protein product [Bursaphelenchus okinawaensis]CAG9084940.1 unnamed protein product [Bursaphelenchus okinawaensis]